jgi:uncharacterized protein YcsI (UPF0317 family)
MTVPKSESALRAQIASQAVSPAHETRLLARHNLLTNTSGCAPGYLQANLIILPSKHAEHFRALCARNPVSCPLLGITPKGDPHTILPAGCIKTPDDFDIRTDFPAYRVYGSGKMVESHRTDLLDVWTDDHVGFLIGCSFSFEDALTQAGLRPRHQETGTLVAMYRSTIPVLPAGIFTGATCVVSMRPYKPEDVERVRDVTRPFLATHGEPVAWGWEGAKSIGVGDIEKPDFGAPQRFEEGEVPVFWVRNTSLRSLLGGKSGRKEAAKEEEESHSLMCMTQACGVTPQLIVEAAGDKVDGLVFAHEPGHMLVTDWTAEDLERVKS